MDLEIGFKQRLNAATLGAKGVADTDDRDHHIGRRWLAGPLGRRPEYRRGCRGMTCHQLPVPMSSQRASDCRESAISVSSLDGPGRCGLFMLLGLASNDALSRKAACTGCLLRSP